MLWSEVRKTYLNKWIVFDSLKQHEEEDKLIMHLSNGGEPSPDDNGAGSPYYFASERGLMMNKYKICKQN